LDHGAGDVARRGSAQESHRRADVFQPDEAAARLALLHLVARGLFARDRFGLTYDNRLIEAALKKYHAPVPQ